jgi:hypothetical protein
MSKETIIAIAKFQCHYLEQLYNNVPEDKLYERQLQGYNSAGWVMGHLAVEADSVLHHLKIRKLPKLKGWKNKKIQWTFDNYVNLRHLEVIGIMRSDRIEDGKFISIKPLSLGIWWRCFRKF